MHVLISGSSGLIGTALSERLVQSGHAVTALVRREPGTGQIRWNPTAGSFPDGALEGVDAVVNLAGAGINDHRWTDDYKRELIDSRLKGTKLLAAAIATATAPPSVFVSGSAIGYYGPRGDEVLDEHTPPGTTFLAHLAADWELAAVAARSPRTRVVPIRTGIVLAPKGGALRKELPLFKLGLGGRFGSGRQWQSWISLADEVAAIEHLLTADVDEPANLTAPNPVTNAEMTRLLAAAVHRPAILPIPSFGPKLLLGGELAEALLFTGQRVVPTVLERSGYEFHDPQLDEALRTMLR